MTAQLRFGAGIFLFDRRLSSMRMSDAKSDKGWRNGTVIDCDQEVIEVQTLKGEIVRRREKAGRNPALDHCQGQPPEGGVGGSDFSRLGGIVRHVLDKLLDAAIEVFAQSIQDVRSGVVAFLAAQLGERHAVNSGAAGDLLERDAASGRKGHIGNSLLEPESDHVVLRLSKMSEKR